MPLEISAVGTRFLTIGNHTYNVEYIKKIKCDKGRIHIISYQGGTNEYETHTFSSEKLANDTYRVILDVLKTM